MYVMKLEELKGRGKIRTHSGLFSMGALAIALSACGSTFELADKDAVVPDSNGTVVKVTFTEEPKSVSTTATDYVTGNGEPKVTVVSLSAKVVTFTFDGTANKITVKLAEGKASSFQDHDSKDYALNLTIDNQAPSAVQDGSGGVAGNVVTVKFDEKITDAVASKFNIDGTAATSAVVDSADNTGMTVKVTFATAPTGTVTIEAGAVQDDAASGSNTENLQNKKGGITIGTTPVADTTAPVLADTDPIAASKGAKTITVTFDETIATVDQTKFTVKYDDAGAGAEKTLVADATTDGFTVAVAGGKVVVTLALTALADGDKVTVAIAAEGVTDSDGNKNDAVADEEYTVLAGDASEDGLIGLSLGSADSDYGL